MTKRERAAANHEIKTLHRAAQTLYSTYCTLSNTEDLGDMIDDLYLKHQTLLERAKRIAFRDDTLLEAWVNTLDEEILDMRDADRRVRAARK